jgi:phosphohistidine phosphatase
MRRIAHAAALVLPELDVVATSQLTRAVQTAKILSAVYSDAEIVRVESLAPDGAHPATIAWLAQHANLRCVALVGHEPDLSTLLATLISGNATPFFEFKKGGMALVSFSGKPSAGSARLEWALTPSVARQIRSPRG